jgi:lysophospholipase L1-like esterase
MCRFLLSLLCTLFAAAPAAAQTAPFALHDGDRVAFYGDSITAQRFYTRFVEDFVLTRYPQMHIDFANAGVPGDTVYGGYTGDMPTRLKRDLFPYKPTVITIMLGMNDGYYMPFEQKYFEVFKDGYTKLLTAMQTGAPGARITLISPTPYDEVTHGTEFANYDDTVHRYADFVPSFAAQSHLGFCDFNSTVSKVLVAGKQKEPSLAALLVPDRIHPGEALHWVMAAALAHCWGASPIVSSVQIDAAKASVVTQQNTAITGLAATNGHLAWVQTDDALPLPLPLENAMIPFVLSISDLAAMDQQMLRVEGLTAASYALSIDGHKIGDFSREQLATGVNLAVLATPMENQAKGVDGIELKRMRLDEARFIVAVEDPKAAGAADAVTVLESKDAALAAEQRQEARPKPHHLELTPQ